MANIKIVSGANWGDEGKGLVTNHLTTGRDTLIVLASNSAQRGHTVYHNGMRHVFHHFGAGTLKGATTYLAPQFLINPAIFRKEYEELVAMGVYPKVYYNPKSAIVTPYDMLGNQIIETSRGEDRHGSCGCGVWETIQRYEFLLNNGVSKQALTLEEPFDFINKGLPVIENFISNRFSGSQLMQDFMVKGSHDHFVDDLFFFLGHAEPIYDHYFERKMFDRFNTIIFENSQGLKLDTNYESFTDHTTPAHVGTLTPTYILHRLYGDTPNNVYIENYYVTRTYFTRHGAGPFIECSKAAINASMIDETNCPNEWQGSLRYGIITPNAAQKMIKRITLDHDYLRHFPNKSLNLVITHTNEYHSQPLFDALEERPDINVYTSGNVVTFHEKF